MHSWNSDYPGTSSEQSSPLAETQPEITVDFIYEQCDSGLSDTYSNKGILPTAGLAKSYRILDSYFPSGSTMRMRVLTEASWVEGGQAKKAKEIFFISTTINWFCIQGGEYYDSSTVSFIFSDDFDKVKSTSRTLGGIISPSVDGATLSLLTFGYLDLQSTEFPYSVGFIDGVAAFGTGETAVSSTQVEAISDLAFSGGIVNTALNY